MVVVDVEFEWDPAKAARNFAVHGVTFEDASLVFFDQNSVFELNAVDEGEQRWQVTGFADNQALLVVVHVLRERPGVDVIRIISARQAERNERRRYERENGSIQS